MEPQGTIEQGLALLHELIGEDAALASELEASAAEFFGGERPSPKPGSSDEDVHQHALAGRRHFEWFACERPSDVVGGVPVEALMPQWVERADPLLRDYGELLLGSLAGVFEVSGTEPGRGVWITDLAGLGEYPLDDRRLAEDVHVGDLIVGRVFPIGDGLFCVSPACDLYRSAELRDALRRDLETARQARRGTLRIGQAELERMFHAPHAAPDGAQGGDPNRALAEARAMLLEGGCDPARTEAWLQQLTTDLGDAGDPVARLLDEIAFETDVDLERARAVLSETWRVLRLAAESAMGEPGPARPAPSAPSVRRRGGASGPDSRTGRKLDVDEALAEFDRGRESGGDLDDLFGELERNLGLASGGDVEPDDAAPAPDFPGVVGAMVAEFRWELAADSVDGRAPAAAMHPSLDEFARFTEEIGVLEELTVSHVLGFLGIVLVDGARPGDPAELLGALEAIEAFCTWCEAAQHLDLRAGLEMALPELRESLPRLARANRACVADAGDATDVYRIRELEGGRATLEDAEAGSLEVELDRALAGELRPGDLLRGTLLEDGTLAVHSAHPGVLRDVWGELSRDAG